MARRLILAFLAVTVPGAVLLALVTVLAIRQLVVANGQLQEINRSLETTRDLNATLDEALVPAQAWVLHGGSHRRGEFDAILTRANTIVAQCISAACHASETRTPQQMGTQLLDTLDALGERAHVVFGEDSAPQAAQAAVEDLERIVGVAGAKLERMSDALRDRAEVLRVHSYRVGRRALLLTCSFATTIVLVACLVAILLARRIVRPLHELLLGTRRIMAGDLDSQVPVGSPDEIGELGASFNAMIDRLQGYRTQLHEHNRMLEQRVRERTEELERKDLALRQSEHLAAVGLLASGVAHELNNPLTSIVMNVNLALEGVDPAAPIARDLRRIDADAARCRRIIDDLRTFSRHPELQKARGKVAPVVDEALEHVAHELDARDIRVAREVAPDLPEVDWDEGRMVQVLVNLLTNAAQSMPAGGALTVSARPDGQWLRLCVRDTGPGIAPENRSRVFDPFFSTKPGGTGLGLSISYGIVAEHGGRLEIDSQCRADVGSEGHTGTCAEIILPLAEQSS